MFLVCFAAWYEGNVFCTAFCFDGSEQYPDLLAACIIAEIESAIYIGMFKTAEEALERI